MNVYHRATQEELVKLDTSDDCEVLIGPDGFVCYLGEPEDCTWGRDAAPVVRELNRLHEIITDYKEYLQKRCDNE